MNAVPDDLVFELELEAELQLARHATLLVASGASPRVVVANIRHGRVIVAPAREFASDVGVSIATLPTADPSRVDLVVLASGPARVEAA